jgi:hypothetical protein
MFLARTAELRWPMGKMDGEGIASQKWGGEAAIACAF